MQSSFSSLIVQKSIHLFNQIKLDLLEFIFVIFEVAVQVQWYNSKS